MWDGRETFKDPSSPNGFAALHFDLAHQSVDATTGHAQATREPSTAEQERIVAFEMQLYTAQVWDVRAGLLAAADAQGGPGPLAGQAFYWESTTRSVPSHRTPVRSDGVHALRCVELVVRHRRPRAPG